MRRISVNVSWAVATAWLLVVAPAELASGSPGKASPRGREGCRPNCRGKACGPDGCGGSCGRCRRGSACLKNRCVKAPKGDPCVAMTGRWTGTMPATSSHVAEYLRGRIWGTAKACRARFVVTYAHSGRQVKVIEDFTVTVWGARTRRRARFVCTKVTTVTPGVNYSPDTFTGRLNLRLTRFSGRVLDTAGNTSPVHLTKK